LYRDVVGDAEIPQGDKRPTIRVKKGDRIWASLRKAYRDVCHLHRFFLFSFFDFSLPQSFDFTDPEIVDPRRPKSLYNVTPASFDNWPGVAEFAEVVVAEFVRAAFKLKNIRRAAGGAGKLVKFTTMVNQTETDVYVSPTGSTSSFPRSMHIAVSNYTNGRLLPINNMMVSVRLMMTFRGP